MLDNFGVFRREDKMQAQLGIVDGLRERYARSSSRTRATRSTPT